MDKKAKELIGQPVVTRNRGTKIYDVEDMIVDPERRQVLALVVSESSLFQSAKAVPFGRISAMGRDAIIVADGKAVIDVNRDRVLKGLYNKNTIRGLRVLTEDGTRLGTVDDLLLDSTTGEIKGYYVSIGKVLNMTQGTRWLPADRVLSTGQRLMYVPADVATDFENQLGGWAGALDQAGEKLRTAGGRASERLEDFGNKARTGGAQLNDQLGQFGGQIQETIPQRASSFLLGKIASDTVKAKDETTIVQKGDVVTQETIDVARKEGRLPQLFLAAGSGTAQEAVGPLGENAGQSLRDIQTEARELWNKLMGGYGKSVDTADEKLMDRRVKTALGRPVTRVILDADDNIIINTGEIVTNRALQAAREAGVLDLLVESVYTDKPKLGLEDLKAARVGQAGLLTQATTQQEAAENEASTRQSSRLSKDA